jgi:hypothetical protein
MMRQRLRTSRRHVLLWAVALTMSVASLTLGRFILSTIGGGDATAIATAVAGSAFSESAASRHLGIVVPAADTADSSSSTTSIHNNQSIIIEEAEDAAAVVSTALGIEFRLAQIESNATSESNDDDEEEEDDEEDDEEEDDDDHRLSLEDSTNSSAPEQVQTRSNLKTAASPMLIHNVMWDDVQHNTESNAAALHKPVVESWTATDSSSNGPVTGNSGAAAAATPKQSATNLHLLETTKAHQQLIQSQAQRVTTTATQQHAMAKLIPKTHKRPNERDQKYYRKSFMDIISIGTLTKPHQQAAQERTFGSHFAVRNFYRINELNDTDATCYTNLTLRQVNKAADFCGQRDGQSYESALIRQKLRPFQEYRKSTGWLCAQKRPIDGLWLVLQRYKSGQERPPSYLVIVDDDTYINMTPLVGTLHNAHSPNAHYILGGCIFHLPRELRFTFPYGGYATILTRKVIENLLKPLYCDNQHDPDGFTRFACWRLRQNHVGERRFFTDGMSVADLMYSYATGLPFTQVDAWKDGTGFCFHSDQALGYFFGFYHVGIPDHKLEKAAASGEVSDKLRRSGHHYSYITLGYGNQCDNERDACNDESMICHYQKPSMMDRLFAMENAEQPDVGAVAEANSAAAVIVTTK